MAKKNLAIDESELVNDYQNGFGIEKLATKYHTGKLNVKDILARNGVKLRDKHDKKIIRNFVVADTKIKKYLPVDGYHYVAIFREDGTRFLDTENKGGFLTSYIEKKTGEPTPPLYARNIYYQETGNYWWEQWFDIVLEKDADVKKCPYCDWTTVDLKNRSGMFYNHIKTVHNMTKIEYLKEHPEDREYFSMANKTKELQELETDESKFITCPICGEKFRILSTNHLLKHGLTRHEIITKYSDYICKDTYDKLKESLKRGNIAIGEKDNIQKMISASEKDLKYYIEKDLGIKTKRDRSILEGREIDILIPDKKIGIEYDGLKWHTEWFAGKDKYFHLRKTEDCEKKGISLIHIFEDEYELHKDIVKEKIAHILGVQQDKIKIAGRKCEICKINSDLARWFLDKYHIQGGTNATAYYGAYFFGKLIAVMTFLQESEGMWNLTRFASDYDVVCQGVGGKIFSQFVKDYNPIEVKSFADRRWTINRDNNFYTKLGFELTDILAPDYRYYNGREGRYNRIHKFLFRKEKLSKKYGLSMDMTETEMAKTLGYDRIWDCGLYKYVWKRKNGGV